MMRKWKGLIKWLYIKNKKKMKKLASSILGVYFFFKFKIFENILHLCIM